MKNILYIIALVFAVNAQAQTQNEGRYTTRFFPPSFVDTLEATAKGANRPGNVIIVRGSNPGFYYRDAGNTKWITMLQNEFNPVFTNPSAIPPVPGSIMTKQRSDSLYKISVIQLNDSTAQFKQGDSTWNWAFSGGGSGSGITNPPTQYVFSGTSYTVTNASGNIKVVINPNTALGTLSLIFPSTPYDGQEVTYSFGGTIDANENVVTTLSMVANSGQVIYQNLVPSSADGGDTYKYFYQASNNRWRAIN